MHKHYGHNLPLLRIRLVEDELARLEEDVVVARGAVLVGEDVGDGEKIDRTIWVIHRLRPVKMNDCTILCLYLRLRRRYTSRRGLLAVAVRHRDCR